MLGRVQADVHGDIVLHHLPVLQALRTAGVNRYWRACCAALFDPTAMRAACGRGLLRQGGLGWAKLQTRGDDLEAPLPVRWPGES